MAGAMSGSTMTEPRHIKSRERVRDLGVVYTQPREVNAMLDLIPDAFTAYTGLRWGEVTGVRVRNVDLKRRRVLIEENASK